jgi:hypothetical protein
LFPARDEAQHVAFTAQQQAQADLNSYPCFPDNRLGVFAQTWQKVKRLVGCLARGYLNSYDPSSGAAGRILHERGCVSSECRKQIHRHLLIDLGKGQSTHDQGRVLLLKLPGG